MYNNKRVVVVMPCYNEEEGLERMLQKRPAFIDEVIVVDNNSNDKTADIARKYGATLVLEKERGYGAAYRKGLLYQSGYDIIVMMDGDDSYLISEVENFLSVMEKDGYDFLSGCRFPLVEKKSMAFMRRIGNRFLSYLIRGRFHIKLRDSQSGMFVFKTSILKEILPRNTGMGFSQEIKIKAWLNRTIKSSELHINYQVRGGTSKFMTLLDSLKLVLFLFSSPDSR